MKLVFMGTPEFAVSSLLSLINSRHKVLAVVTQPDKPIGRKKTLTPPIVKEIAVKNAIPVFQYEKISRDGVEQLTALKPDIMVTCAYGQILSQKIIDIAPKGIINVHASLLPRYRGASPIQSAIINGETKTGVTIMQTVKDLDAGDIFTAEATEILPEETAGELSERLSKIGAELLIKTLDLIEKDEIIPTKQDEGLVTFVKPIKKEAALLDFSFSPLAFVNFVRGLNPAPTAYCYLKEKVLKIYTAEIYNGDGFEQKAAGEVVAADLKNGLIIALENGFVSIKELMLEGGKRLSAREFINGRKIAVGDKLTKC